nr:hypothetical protein [Tanacetum cinerariifolium]
MFHHRQSPTWLPILIPSHGNSRKLLIRSQRHQWRINLYLLMPHLQPYYQTTLMTPRSPFAEACIIEFAVALPSSLPPPPENIKSLKDNIRSYFAYMLSSWSVMIFPWMKFHIYFIPCDLQETMTNVNQGMSVEEIERVVAQRVANAIEAIVIYDTKTNLARKSISQTERQKEKVVENASNKRKWEGNHNGSSSQQNKGHKVPRAHTAWQINKKAYAGSLPLCNQCKFHHNGPYTCNRFGHLARDCRSSINANTSNIQKGTGSSQKATCYERGNQGNYRKICPGQKNQNHENQVKNSKARGVVHAFRGGETKQDFNNVENEIEA